MGKLEGLSCKAERYQLDFFFYCLEINPNAAENVQAFSLFPDASGERDSIGRSTV